MDGLFSAGKTIFDTFIRDPLSMSINLVLTLYLVFPVYLFNMGPALLFSRSVETLSVEGYLTLSLLTQRNLYGS